MSVEISGFDVSRIVSIRIEQQPGNVFKRATIQVWAPTSQPSSIEIKYEGQIIFKGDLTGYAYNLRDDALTTFYYKSGKVLIETVKNTDVLVVGEKNKRILFDKLNYKIAKHLQESLPPVGFFLKAVNPKYPDGVEYVVGNVANSLETKYFIPFEFVVTTGVEKEDGSICLPDYYSGTCPSGYQLVVYGWVAKNKTNAGTNIVPGTDYLGWEVQKVFVTSEDKVLTESSFLNLINTLFDNCNVYTDIDFWVWEDLYIPLEMNKMEFFQSLLGNLPYSLFVDETNNSVHLYLKLIQETIELNNAGEIFELSESQNFESLPGRFRYTTPSIERPIPPYVSDGINNIFIPSVTVIPNSQARFFSTSFVYDTGGFNSSVYNIDLPNLFPKDLDKFQGQVINVIEATTSTKTVTVKTKLLPSVKSYLTKVKVLGETLTVQGFEHEITSEGAFTTLFLR